MVFNDAEENIHFARGILNASFKVQYIDFIVDETQLTMRREMLLSSICKTVNKMVRLVIGDNLHDVRHISFSFREGIV